jgi:DNA topoisomerase IA
MFKRVSETSVETKPDTSYFNYDVHLRLIAEQIAWADEIVNACDLDGEGELAFHEVVEYVGVNSGQNLKRLNCLGFTENELLNYNEKLEDAHSLTYQLALDAAKEEDLAHYLDRQSSVPTDP